MLVWLGSRFDTNRRRNFLLAYATYLDVTERLFRNEGVELPPPPKKRIQLEKKFLSEATTPALESTQHPMECNSGCKGANTWSHTSTPQYILSERYLKTLLYLRVSSMLYIRPQQNPRRGPSDWSVGASNHED